MTQPHVSMTQEQLDGLLAKAVASSPPSTHSLSKDELENVVSKGIQKAFVAFGIATDHPLEMQKDFAFLRSLRNGVEGIRSHTLRVICGTIVTGLIALIWLGYKVFAGSK